MKSIAARAPWFTEKDRIQHYGRYLVCKVEEREDGTAKVSELSEILFGFEAKLVEDDKYVFLSIPDPCHYVRFSGNGSRENT